MTFRPLLASTIDDVSTLSFPRYVSYKLDGIRCIIVQGKAMSRSMKPIPNKFVQKWAEENMNRLAGLDGELIVGPPNAPDVYRTTNSAMMRIEGEPDFKFYVFDSIVRADLRYKDRYTILNTNLRQNKIPRVEMLTHMVADDAEQVAEIEAIALAAGYEGLMLRDPDGQYKQGRATVKGGELLKVKRFVDEEFEVVGFEELMHNANELTASELGLAKRSSHQENLVPMGTLGSMVLKFGDTTFKVGTGFDAATRQDIWNNRDQCLGKLAKIKHFPIGAKDLPRFPVFLGFRDPIDL